MANFFEDLETSDPQSQPQQDSAQPIAQAPDTTTNGNFFSQFDEPAEKPSSKKNDDQEEPGISGVLRRWGNSPTAVDYSDLPKSGQGLSLSQKLGAGATALGRGLIGIGEDAGKSMARGVVGLNDRASGVEPAESSDVPYNERQTLSPDEMGILTAVSPASAAIGTKSIAGKGATAVDSAAAKAAPTIRDALTETAENEVNPKPLPTAQSRGLDITQKALQADGYTPEMVEQAADKLDAGLKTGKPLTALDVLTKDKGGVLTQGRNLVNMTKAAATLPGEAANLSGEVAMRGATAADRIGADFDNSIANNDFYGAKDLVAEGKKAAAPFYQKFYTANPSMQSPLIDNLLNRPAGRQALANVREDMQNEAARMGLPNPELTEQAADAGINAPGGVASGLKAETLDRVKQQLDQMAASAKRAMDMGTDKNARRDYYGLSNMASDLRGEMDRLDVTAKAGPNSFKPEGGMYAQGRKVSAQQFQIDDALDAGRQSFARNTDPEEIQRWFNDPETSEPVKAAFLTGQRRALQDVIDRKAVGKNPITNFTAPVITKKLEATLGPDGYAPLQEALGHETQMAKVNGVHTGGSDTMIKNNYGEQFNQQPMSIATGIKAAMQPKQTALNAVDAYFGRRADAANQAVAGEVMRHMTTSDPEVLRGIAQAMRQKQKPLKVTIRPSSVQPINKAKGGAVFPRPKSYPAIEKMRKRHA